VSKVASEETEPVRSRERSASERVVDAKEVKYSALTYGHVARTLQSRAKKRTGRS